MRDLRCSVCFFLLKPLDLDEDEPVELIIKAGYSLCEEHVYISTFEGYNAAIADGNAATVKATAPEGDGS